MIFVLCNKSWVVEFDFKVVVEIGMCIGLF